LNPAVDDKRDYAVAHRHDAEILSLARLSVDLNPITLHNISGREGSDRYRSALVAYRALMIPRNPDISVVLLVRRSKQSARRPCHGARSR
jgi:hypothetical protein